MKFISSLTRYVVQMFQRAFSPKVEESIRLRTIGVAFLWLAGLGLVWAGGSPWLTLGGAALGTVGYLVSWYRRNRPSRIWALLIATAIITIAFVMRGQVLEALTGNWLPLGQFMLLVQALASFDMRTRGGLYTTVIISGLVLFFASQQAFNDVFGVFIIGFVVLLLAFLTVSFLEDGVLSARVYWKKHQPSTVIFWVGTTCGVFALSGMVFWIMPRGETNLGLAQVAILPFSTNALEDAAPVPEINPSLIPVSLDQTEENGVRSNNSRFDPGSPSGLSGGQETPGNVHPDPAAPGEIPGDAFLGNVDAFGVQNDVMFFVRSKVASYWKGRTLDTFDGQHWRTSDTPSSLAPSIYVPGTLINQESRGLDNRLRYSQTFFIQQDVADVVFTGYRGVRIIAAEGSLLGAGVRAGDSYRVLSAHPRHTLEGLRLSEAGWLGSRYRSLPPNSGRLRELASQITEGSTSDFAKMERIMGYLASQDNYDRNRPGDLTSSASLDQFLFENEDGSALDYATATVMLARASGLSSRLAMGYLPGVRDPLSGAYMVRESDAHAWAEVYFEGQGWVPIDNAPRPDIKLLFDEGGGTGFLLQGGAGEKAFQAVQATPGKVAETIPGLVNNQALWAGSAVLFFIVSVALSWRRFRWLGRRRRDAADSGLAYSLLSGDERREVLKLYRRVEKLLRRHLDVGQRESWQTVGEHNQWLTAGGTDLQEQVLQEQVSWFTSAVWQVAYNPEDVPSGLGAEARQRLERLKRALRIHHP